MTVNVTNHINFRGEARAALEFYRSVVGGDLVVFTYADFHDTEHADQADQIVWGQVTGGNGFRVMAYDVQSERAFDRGQNSFYISLRGDDADEITGLWTKLSVGASVLVPLGPSPWAPLYGMLVDPFGITWVVDVTAQYDAG